MKHSFLLEEGEWATKGNYIDENNNQYDLSGEVKITHGKEKWMNQTDLILQKEEPLKIKNCFEITPFSDGLDYTDWRAANPEMGEMIGRFMVFDTCIISTYRTEDNLYSGIEYVTRYSEDHYICKGMAFKGDVKSASWTLSLVRCK